MLTAILILVIFNVFFLLCTMAAIGNLNRKFDELQEWMKR